MMYFVNDDWNSTLAENEIENEFISGEVGDAVSWIGLRIGTDGTRKWVDSHLGSGYHNLAGTLLCEGKRL